jgi:hypothetical protein
MSVQCNAGSRCDAVISISGDGHGHLDCIRAGKFFIPISCSQRTNELVDQPIDIPSSVNFYYHRFAFSRSHVLLSVLLGKCWHNILKKVTNSSFHILHNSSFIVILLSDIIQKYEADKTSLNKLRSVSH